MSGGIIACQSSQEVVLSVLAINRAQSASNITAEAPKNRLVKEALDGTRDDRKTNVVKNSQSPKRLSC